MFQIWWSMSIPTSSNIMVNDSTISFFSLSLSLSLPPSLSHLAASTQLSEASCETPVANSPEDSLVPKMVPSGHLPLLDSTHSDKNWSKLSVGILTFPTYGKTKTLYLVISGYIWLSPTPLKKYIVVNWDDDIPNNMGKKNMFQTTHQSFRRFWPWSPPESQPVAWWRFKEVMADGYRNERSMSINLLCGI